MLDGVTIVLILILIGYSLIALDEFEKYLKLCKKYKNTKSL